MKKPNNVHFQDVDKVYCHHSLNFVRRVESFALALATQLAIHSWCWASGLSGATPSLNIASMLSLHFLCSTLSGVDDALDCFFGRFAGRELLDICALLLQPTSKIFIIVAKLPVCKINETV